MELTTLLIIALAVAIGMATYYGVRMHQLQKKITTIKKFMDEADKRLHGDLTQEASKQPEWKEELCDNMEKNVHGDLDYDAIIWFPKEGTWSYYKLTND